MLHVRPGELAVFSEDPFKFDTMGRKTSVEVLTQFVGLANPPYVLALDSPWGTGKTTFLKMWRFALQREKYASIYFNAWENDFAEDPLVPILATLDKYVSELNLSTDKLKTAADHLSNAKTFGARLARIAVPTLIKILTSGVLDLDKGFDAAIGELSEKLVKSEIEAHKRDKEDIDKFRSNLEGIVAAVNESNGGDKNQPFLFMIDELDRCKPTFAVKLLERVKHVFDASNVVFVLSLDKGQLGHAVKAVYGEGMDVDGYLARFIDVQYRLPMNAQEGFILGLLQKSDLNDALGQDAVFIRETMSQLVGLFECSLRDTEHAISRMNIARLIMKPARASGAHFILLGLLALLRTKKEDLYWRYLGDSTTAKELVTHLKAPGTNDFWNSNSGILIEVLLFAAKGQTRELHEFRLECEMRVKDTTGDDVSRKLAQRKLDQLNAFSFTPGYGLLPGIAKALELADRMTP